MKVIRINHRVIDKLYGLLKVLFFRVSDLKVWLSEIGLNLYGGKISGGYSEARRTVIGITISTAYDDLLKYVLPRNMELVDFWIVVTDKRDFATREILSHYPKIKIILINFKSFGRVFNKGKGVREAQKFAYKKFPNSWYLLLDSDILLSKNFTTILGDTLLIDDDQLYGCGTRKDFEKLSDLIADRNFQIYAHGGEIHGYFQLYRKKYLYRDSIDASWCDLQFANRFSNHVLLEDIACNHLGTKGNWTGRHSKDFVFDTEQQDFL